MKIPLGKHINLFLPYLHDKRRRLSLIGALILINVGIQVVNPQIIRFYLDSVTKVTDITVIQNAALLFIIMAIAQEVVYIINVYLSVDLAWILSNRLRIDLFTKTIGLDMNFQNKYKPGEMIERVDGDVNALSNFISIFSLMIISNLLLIIGILTAVFLANIIIGSLFTILVTLSLVLMIKSRLIAIEQWKESRQSTSELMGFIEESLGSTEEIKANAGEEKVYQKFHQLSRFEYDNINKAILKSRITPMIVFFLIGVGTTLTFAIGVPMVPNTISLGTLYLFSYYFNLLLVPIFQILRQIQQVQQADASIERVNELFATESSVQDNGVHSILNLRGRAIDIEFKDVTFGYNEDPVLKNISFELPAGKKLGLIGKTGSGKSTISKLLFRLYDIQKGGISLNNLPIDEIKINDLRRIIEMVPQDVEIFHASIRDNVTFFDPNITDIQVQDVLEKVGLDSWLKNQEKGLNTEIDKDSLSSGQAQLLSLSRAFLADPSLVILDEASSRLDPATESMIDLAMQKLLEGRTSIIIAHRLETLNRTDLILLLDEGEVKEFGEREKLKNDPGSYYSELLEVGLEVAFS